MRVCKLKTDAGPRVGVVIDGTVHVQPADSGVLETLHRVRHAGPDGSRRFSDRAECTVPFDRAELLAPIDGQEVWACGVTYTRSKAARMEESPDGADFYGRVYEAERPEIFLKATARLVSGPGQPVRIRRDAKWSVPEPELTLCLARKTGEGTDHALEIIGYTVGNDMSARDIEGENPLYLPQAKTYDGCAGLGPVLAPTWALPELAAVAVRLEIRRGGQVAFAGETTLDRLHRRPEDLVRWLTAETSFPEGCFLMTGTGIVPPSDFTLAAGDETSITIGGIGTLTQPVVRGD